jgi:hypothetical protein
MLPTRQRFYQRSRRQLPAAPRNFRWCDGSGLDPIKSGRAATSDDPFRRRMALCLSRVSGVTNACALARVRFPAPLIPAIIFSRIAGSTHRALVASRILARLTGSRSAARVLAPITGSAHRAFAAREYALARVCPINPAPVKEMGWRAVNRGNASKRLVMRVWTVPC